MKNINLDIEKVLDFLEGHSVSFSIDCVGCLRSYDINIKHNIFNENEYRVKIGKIGNSFNIFIESNLIKDFIVFSDSDINEELLKILSKVIKFPIEGKASESKRDS